MVSAFLLLLLLLFGAFFPRIPCVHFTTPSPHSHNPTQLSTTNRDITSSLIPAELRRTSRTLTKLPWNRQNLKVSGAVRRKLYARITIAAAIKCSRRITMKSRKKTRKIAIKKRRNKSVALENPPTILL